MPQNVRSLSLLMFLGVAKAALELEIYFLIQGGSSYVTHKNQ